MPTWTVYYDQDFANNTDTATGGAGNTTAVPAQSGGTGTGAWVDVLGGIWHIASGNLVGVTGSNFGTAFLKRSPA